MPLLLSLIALFVSVAAAAIVLVCAGSFLFGVFLLLRRGAPYVPVSQSRMSAMLALANIQPGERVVDLGSGDGRLVVAAAEAGAEAEGYELQPLLVWFSRWRIMRKGLRGRARVLWKNLWDADLAAADIVFVYGFPSMMEGLERKLTRELRKGARVVSCSFPFPAWKPLRHEEGVWYYMVDGNNIRQRDV